MSTVEMGPEVLKNVRVEPARGLKQRVEMFLALPFLIVSDLAMNFLGFKRLYKLVARWPSWPWASTSSLERARELSQAMDRAAVLYLKHPWCLQRSSAAVLFMRTLGVRAEMAIGVRRVPFYTHAWVEFLGVAVNEDPQVVEQHFRVIERC